MSFFSPAAPEESRVHFEAALAGPADALLRARLFRKLGDSWVPVSAVDEATAALRSSRAGAWSDTRRRSARLVARSAGIQSSRLWLCYWTRDTPGMSASMARATVAFERLEARGERGTLGRMLTLLELGRTPLHPSAQALQWVGDYVDAAEQSGDLAEMSQARFCGRSFSPGAARSRARCRATS